jgi:hypothetical protein
MLATKPDRRWEHAGGGRWRLYLSDEEGQREAYRNQMQQLAALFMRNACPCCGQQPYGAAWFHDPEEWRHGR